ncbi:MAG: redoxin domain-containing protein, partial [Marinirhabdus sp.]|nr:redoxin domain-containing protein [Marinirhabdus sp.]
VINDTVVEGNTVYTEYHIFIDPTLKQLERVERRNYYNGNLSQRLFNTFSNYLFNDKVTILKYDVPSDYPSVLYGQTDDRKLLEIGQKAPLFDATDLHGRPVNLADVKQPKTLLIFSSINCGNAHDAFQYINYELPEDIAVLYLSIWDELEDVTHYFTELKTEFTIVPNADNIAKTYGVRSTPTFFLIDKKGIVQNVEIGFDKPFLDQLRQ